jgi:ribosomal protein L34E
VTRFERRRRRARRQVEARDHCADCGRPVGLHGELRFYLGPPGDREHSTPLCERCGRKLLRRHAAEEEDTP